MIVSSQLQVLAKSVGKSLLPEKAKEYYKRERLEEIDNSVMIFVLDSCRFDSFKEAYDGQLPAKNIRKAKSPSNWTLPSHESIARGFLPFGDFENPLNVFDLEMGVPLPRQFNYSFDVTSMPYLSDSPYIQNYFHRHFDSYHCTEDSASSTEILKRARKEIPEDKSFFGLINFGETHSPYKKHYERSTQDILDMLDNNEVSYNELHQQQIESATTLLEKIEAFLENIPEGTLVIVTADHGELFGEGGGFGHNPKMRAVFHPKLYEVPLIYFHT